MCHYRYYACCRGLYAGGQLGGPSPQSSRYTPRVPNCWDVPACALQVAEELRVLRHMNCSFEPPPIASVPSSGSAPAQPVTAIATSPETDAPAAVSSAKDAMGDVSDQNGTPGAAEAVAAVAPAEMASGATWRANVSAEDAALMSAAAAEAEADLARLSGGRALLLAARAAEAEADLDPADLRWIRGVRALLAAPEGGTDPKEQRGLLGAAKAGSRSSPTKVPKGKAPSPPRSEGGGTAKALVSPGSSFGTTAESATDRGPARVRSPGLSSQNSPVVPSKTPSALREGSDSSSGDRDSSSSSKGGTRQRDSSNSSSSKGVTRRRGSSDGGGWERTPGMPSWNDCFRCMFSYCGGYQGPRADGVCTESLGRWEGLGLWGSTRGKGGGQTPAGAAAASGAAKDLTPAGVCTESLGR